MAIVDLKTLCLSHIPTSEDGTFEFKSSSTPLGELKRKIGRAASGFANSGGGCLIVGVDDSGNADGGLAETVGRQTLQDWVDQALHTIMPPVTYEVRLLHDACERGTLEDGKVVLAVFFPLSESAPHMAADCRYYIRAGAHTVPAPAFIVESLWSRRGANKPMLTHAVRTSPNNYHVVQIGVVALNSTPALDVKFDITSKKGFLKKMEKYFPIRLPVVDRNTPFFVDATIYSNFYEEFDEQVIVKLKYKDTAGNSYEYQSSRPLREAISPKQEGAGPAEKIANAIRQLGRQQRMGVAGPILSGPLPPNKTPKADG